MTSFNQFIQSIQADGNDGKAFEVFCKWFLQHDPEWATQVDEVWLWNEWPDKWGPDCGIDLIFKHKNGETWAVQAKCYDTNYPVTKKDMDTFLSETSRAVIDKRLLLTSTDLMSANAIRTCDHQEKDVVRFMLHNFEEAAVNYPAHISQLNKVKPKKKPAPRPHQKQAVDDTALGLKTHDRGQLIMACGTGKTFTTLWIRERLKAGNTLVLLPSLNLLGQTMREWTAAWNDPFAVLCVCSDSSVGRKNEDMGVSEAPFPVTSQTDEIERFLRDAGPKVIFCTYQSSDLIAEVQKNKAVPDFDLVVADEAHRCAGKADAAFSTVLDGEAIRASKRLFTTATPRIYTTSLSKKAEERGVEIIGMDDVAAFGPRLHTLTFGQAIHNVPPLLTDYQVVVVGVDEPMVKQWIDEGEIIALNPDDATDARSLASKIGLIKAIRDYDLKRVISFHSRVKGAKDFSVELSDIIQLIDESHRPQGSFWTDFVSGEMSAGDRTTKIKKLKDLGSADRGLLTNARCLSEGVDVPALDGVAFIDPKGSQVDIIQAVGRAIRKSDDKEKGTIVIPVFIEDGDDVEASIEASNFKPVWDVVKALRSHDEVLANELDQYRTNMAKGFGGTSKGLSDKLVFDLPVSIDAGFSGALRTVLVEATTASWNFWFGLLETYKSAHGDCNVPAKWPENQQLGTWVSNQRRQRDGLSEDRQSRLDALGFDWDPLTTAWEQMFAALVQYKAAHGDCNVPKRWPENPQLGTWVGELRKHRDRLSEDRQSRLDALGFDWDPLATAWEQMFAALAKHEAAHGDCNVPNRWPENPQLGTWVLTQRKHRDSLSEDRQSRLDALGFDWDPLATAWEQMFATLAKYKAAHGDCTVPKRWPENPQLGTWVGVQRKQRDSLSEDRRSRLDALGFDWDPLATAWEQMFAELVQYKAVHGDCNVPGSWPENAKLGTWVGELRKHRDRLSEDRRSRLDALGFDWDPLATAWEQMFAALAKHKAAHGDCKVPNRWPENPQLARWVLTQRTNRDSLSEDRQSRLDALGFDWDPLATAWEQMFAELVQYKATHGDCNVPNRWPENRKLGTWVGELRKQRDGLSEDRQSRLDALGFDWDPLATAWEQMFAALAKHKAAHGDCAVPNRWPENPQLGTWVTNQRANARKGKMPEDRRRRLEEIGFRF